MGRGRFDGPVGLDVPVAVPEVVDTLGTSRSPLCQPKSCDVYRGGIGCMIVLMTVLCS